MKWVLDTILWMGWCYIIVAVLLLVMIPMALSRPGWGDPSQLVGAALLLLPTAVVCFVIVKSPGQSLNPYHNIIKFGKGWHERTLAEKKEWVRVGFALMRSVWLAGAYACLCLWVFSSNVHGGSLLPGTAGFMLALFSGMVLAEALLCAVFLERPIFSKFGLYLMVLLFAATFCIVIRVVTELNGLDNYLVGLTAAAILAAVATIVRFATLPFFVS